MLQRAILAENAANEIATNWVSLSTPLGNAGLKCSLTDYVGRRVAASVLRRARAGVLQTSQTWPEIAGSKYGELAKPSERFQRLSPKAVVLPLHHSPMECRINSITYGIVRQWSARPSANRYSTTQRRSTRSVPALANAWQRGFQVANRLRLASVPARISGSSK